MLHEGLRDDLPCYLNRDLLLHLWPVLRTLVGRTVRSVREDKIPPARLPHPGSRMTDVPEPHTRLLADVLALGSPYHLVLTGGYAARAHRLVNRPSQDLDVATENPAPMATIAATLRAGLEARCWKVHALETAPPSARFTVTEPATGQECEVDILKEIFWRPVARSPYGPVLAEEDVIGTKVRALADRGAPRDLRKRGVPQPLAHLSCCRSPRSCQCDRRSGGEHPVVTQQGPQDPTLRRARAITAWTCLQPSPRFFRQKSRFGPSRVMLVCADRLNTRRRRRLYRFGRCMLPVRRPESRGTGTRPAAEARWPASA